MPQLYRQIERKTLKVPFVKYVGMRAITRLISYTSLRFWSLLPRNGNADSGNWNFSELTLLKVNSFFLSWLKPQTQFFSFESLQFLLILTTFLMYWINVIRFTLLIIQDDSLNFQALGKCSLLSFFRIILPIF